MLVFSSAILLIIKINTMDVRRDVGTDMGHPTSQQQEIVEHEEAKIEVVGCDGGHN